MFFVNERDRLNVRMMAVALIQDAIGKLHEETASDLARFEEAGLGWREWVITRINGQTLPVEFIKLAIYKKWSQWDPADVEGFSRQILEEWGMLEENE
ncbi:MAG: hypothetical protein H6510_01725 [Acidobacteria bacterium]|nr:hypothetical protein [Acidobacteriota bacterium]MCB9396510.1 hypothetical protein [Acidobacteriota bacterium]